ncbi:unnamed protein product, partial [Medioppia subpectinata]
VSSIAKRRKSEKVKPRDYLQLLIEAQDRGNGAQPSGPDTDDKLDTNAEQIFAETGGQALTGHKTSHPIISDDDFVTNSMIFLTAGFDTTSSLLSFLCYELAINELCQQRLYEEINKFSDDINYETISQMPYLEACVAETLRLYNPITTVGRIADEEYTVGDTGLTIPVGMFVAFDLHVLHHSPEYYPDPMRWDPERFLPENRHKLVPKTYMPFGTGPRNCVGMRFALMEAKTAIVQLIRRFQFRRSVNTTIPLKFKKFNFILDAEKDIKIEMQIRD